MPYKSEHVKLPPEYDRRRKLMDDDKIKIIELYQKGISQRELARRFNVSRRLIGLIIDPKKAEAMKQHVKNNWKKYAASRSKEERNEARRNWSHYKHDLYVKGLIGD